MTWEQAIEKAIKQYFDGLETKELKKATKAPKYSKKYFDEIEKEFLGDKGKKHDEH